jgi:hypothetical protein
MNGLHNAILKTKLQFRRSGSIALEYTVKPIGLAKSFGLAKLCGLGKLMSRNES